MPSMKKKACDSSNSDNGDGDDLKQKERHIVSWSEEEDDILREQIGIHGTNNWAIIASKFENKTTRQCRRRWFTYLNSDFKKGGWSPEEDRLLCEAQKIFGNRWTEIAKVVSGRTDNAVKNRFSVLCKKRAKHEASIKENNATADVNINKKRKENAYGIILETSMHPMMTRRKHIASTTEDRNLEGRLVEENRTTTQQQRPPFVLLVQNCLNTNCSTTLVHAETKKAPIDASSDNMVEETFLKKDDPKIVDGKNIGEYDLETNQDVLPLCYELNNDVGGACALPNLEFNSPLQVTPLFRSMAQGIPSPQFSESERNFLLKTLGMEPTPLNTTAGTSQSPPCKKSLLNRL